MSDTPQEVVSVPVSVLEKAIEALKSVIWWQERVGGFCEREDERDVLEPVSAALSALREVVRS